MKRVLILILMIGLFIACEKKEEIDTITDGGVEFVVLERDAVTGTVIKTEQTDGFCPRGQSPCGSESNDCCGDYIDRCDTPGCYDM